MDFCGGDGEGKVEIVLFVQTRTSTVDPTSHKS